MEILQIQFNLSCWPQAETKKDTTIIRRHVCVRTTNKWYFSIPLSGYSTLQPWKNAKQTSVDRRPHNLENLSTINVASNTCIGQTDTKVKRHSQLKPVEQRDYYNEWMISFGNPWNRLHIDIIDSVLVRLSVICEIESGGEVLDFEGFDLNTLGKIWQCRAGGQYDVYHVRIEWLWTSRFD